MDQLKDALNYVVKMGYMHRDIKPMNILLTKYDMDPANVQQIEEQTNDTVNNKTNYHYDNKLVVKLA